MSYQRNESSLNEILEKVSLMRRKSRQFYTEWKEPNQFYLNFHDFRLEYLNILDKMSAELSLDERTKHIIMNILQVCFSLYEEMKNNIDDESCFDSFFYSALFLAVKLESPNLFKRLKILACNTELDLSIIYELEKLVLNRSSWSIYTTTPIEIKNLIISMKNESYSREFIETVDDLINFSLHDYRVYQKFDCFTIAAASLMIACSYMQEDSQIFSEIFEKISADKIMIDDCIASILEKFQDESNEEIQQMNTDASTDTLGESDLNGSGSDISPIRRNSSLSFINSFDSIQFAESMITDENVCGININNFSECSKGLKKSRKNKLKRIKFIKKNLTNRIKTKKSKYFFERRVKVAKRI